MVLVLYSVERGGKDIAGSAKVAHPISLELTMLMMFRILVEPPRCHRTSARDLANTYTGDTRPEGVPGTLVRVPPRLSNREAS